MTPEQQQHFNTVFLPALRRIRQRRDAKYAEWVQHIEQRHGRPPSVVPTELTPDMVVWLDDIIKQGLHRRPEKPQTVAAPTGSQGAHGRILTDAVVEEAALLRRSDPRFWSWRRLGERYGVAGSTIQAAVIKAYPDVLEVAGYRNMTTAEVEEAARLRLQDPIRWTWENLGDRYRVGHRSVAKRVHQYWKETRKA